MSYTTTHYEVTLSIKAPLSDDRWDCFVLNDGQFIFADDFHKLGASPDKFVTERYAADFIISQSKQKLKLDGFTGDAKISLYEVTDTFDEDEDGEFFVEGEQKLIGEFLLVID